MKRRIEDGSDGAGRRRKRPTRHAEQRAPDQDQFTRGRRRNRMLARVPPNGQHINTGAMHKDPSQFPAHHSCHSRKITGGAQRLRGTKRAMTALAAARARPLRRTAKHAESGEFPSRHESTGNESAYDAVERCWRR